MARALAGKPEIIFADEPTGNLDSRSGAEILEFMRRAVREYGQTIVMVTHDPGAASYADRVIFLNDGKIVDEMTEPTAERVLDKMKGIGDELSAAIALIARRSIRARFGRLIAISIAILVGVSFVVGSFVLADSLRKTFDDLFTQISENVDLEVRASVAFGEDSIDLRRDPIPASLADEVAAVEGVAAIEPLLQRYAQLIDQDGEAIATPGRTDARRGLDRVTNRCPDCRSRARDARRRAPTEVAIDKATADREDFAVGDTIQVITDTGTFPFTITALVGLGDSDGFAGATLAAWDVATAQQVTGAIDQFDGVDVSVAEGADPAVVQARIEEMLPPGTEVDHPRGADRREQVAAGHDHRHVPQHPPRVRLRHGVRQRLPHQQRVPDHHRSAAARARPHARRRRRRPPGAPDDLRRGARDGRRRHAARHRRRHPRRARPDQRVQRRRRGVPRHLDRAARRGPWSSPPSSASA